MITKDFLKSVFSEQRKLLKLADLRKISVPKYRELSVNNLWPIIRNDFEVWIYFPNDLPAGREPDREYTFNVLNTIRPEFVSNMITHAMKQRNGTTEQSDHQHDIFVTSKW